MSPPPLPITPHTYPLLGWLRLKPWPIDIQRSSRDRVCHVTWTLSGIPPVYDPSHWWPFDASSMTPFISDHRSIYHVSGLCHHTYQHWNNAGEMLAQRHRWLASIEAALGLLLLVRDNQCLSNILHQKRPLQAWPPVTMWPCNTPSQKVKNMTPPYHHPHDRLPESFRQH